MLGAWLLHATLVAQVTWPDRSLIKGSGPRTYIVAAGKACWIPSAETFNAMGLDWNAIRTISDADLNRIPKSPLLLKGTGPEVYLVEGASRQRIPTADIFAAMGLDLGAILEIGNAQLRAIPEGAPIDRPRGPIPRRHRT